MTTYWVQYSFSTELTVLPTVENINKDLYFQGMDLLLNYTSVDIVANAFGFNGPAGLGPYVRSQQQLGGEGIVGSSDSQYDTILHVSIVNSFVVGSAPDPSVLLGPTAQSATLPTEYAPDGTILFEDKGFIYNTTAWEKITIPDNSAPTINISDAPTVYEAPSGAVHADFTVTLGAASNDRITVDYTTQDGSAHAGSDYQAQTGTITFAPGQTTATVSVPIIGTELTQHNETFFVLLSNPTLSSGPAPTITDASGTGTINALFTKGSDSVDFTNLTADQQQAIAAGADKLNGHGGNDTVRLGNSGQVFNTGSLSGDLYTAYGGDGTDTIIGGIGVDRIAGGKGDDTIDGSGGDDFIVGIDSQVSGATQSGHNRITGGNGTDTVVWSGAYETYFKNLSVSYKDFFLGNSGKLTISTASGSSSDELQDKIEVMRFADVQVPYEQIQGVAG